MYGDYAIDAIILQKKMAKISTKIYFPQISRDINFRAEEVREN